MDALIPFTTSGSLVDLVDKKVLVILRDGRKLIGVFRSYDQFAFLLQPLFFDGILHVLGILMQHANTANFLLESCVERLHYKLEYADKDIGVLLVRGENVVALGEIDLIAEDMVPLQQVNLQEIEEKISAENKQRERDHAVKESVLSKMGFVNEGKEGDAY
ncbi:U6 snRNA-associated Sm-like protein LSm1 [Cryptococcus bacillisporus CA1873]|uniref:U6 snRNA-associated Sm-like protein LSm1 n=2 Tax=Cryptococcus gattii TaxID=552467 RepID=A0A0D0TIU6_CRYGA|nr:U6 snRNA-associated Sm-like protein LSm1 [Cryptococcus bacillisporus CA1280]KIR59488.1 U6 snRNA-associated Sm-like protein LSm1 [Cryptococcus bacillisporus CA1873]|eukprot:KIR59488.1 U6 snRNA-associated Sm-like protein LSm1 [Cryptococcus gattii CA1873]